MVPRSVTVTKLRTNDTVKEANTLLTSKSVPIQPAKKRKMDKSDNDEFTKKIQKNKSKGAVAANATTAPSAPKIPKKYKREVNVKTSYKTFRDVGGMDKVLLELCELLMHIKHPQIYRHIGLPPPRGFLLHGPPGCGKTLLAQAIAGVSFITHTQFL